MHIYSVGALYCDLPVLLQHLDKDTKQVGMEMCFPSVNSPGRQWTLLHKIEPGEVGVRQERNPSLLVTKSSLIVPSAQEPTLHTPSSTSTHRFKRVSPGSQTHPPASPKEFGFQGTEQTWRRSGVNEGSSQRWKGGRSSPLLSSVEGNRAQPCASLALCFLLSVPNSECDL